MNIWKWAWLPILAGFALLRGGSEKRRAPLPGLDNPDVIDAATRTLLAETSFNTRKHSKQELASILQVGINRARETGNPLAVFTAPGVPNWNRSGKFRERWTEASGYPQWAAARAFVVQVFGGAYPNLIGDRKQFLHPAGMPKCVQGRCKPGRICADTTAGKRCLPRWSDDSLAVVIDKARFS